MKLWKSICINYSEIIYAPDGVKNVFHYIHTDLHNDGIYQDTSKILTAFYLFVVPFLSEHLFCLFSIEQSCQVPPVFGRFP